LHKFRSSAGLVAVNSLAKKPLFSLRENIAGNALGCDIVRLPPSNGVLKGSEMTALEFGNVQRFVACDTGAVSVGVGVFVTNVFAELLIGQAFEGL